MSKCKEIEEESLECAEYVKHVDANVFNISPNIWQWVCEVDPNPDQERNLNLESLDPESLDQDLEDKLKSN